MKIDRTGLELIKEFEGFRTNAYQDTGGIWTIGYGNIQHSATGKAVQKGDVVTEEEAEKELLVDVAWAEKAVNTYVTVSITQNQFDALVSFVFNFGPNAFKKSTLLRKLNRGDYKGASKEFLRWIYDDGKIQPGLVKRRNKESFLFLS